MPTKNKKKEPKAKKDKTAKPAAGKKAGEKTTCHMTPGRTD